MLYPNGGKPHGTPRPMTGFSRVDGTMGGNQSGARRSCAGIFVPSPSGQEFEAIRMAHVPARVLDSPTQCRDGIQSDAGVIKAFLLPVDFGCLHAGNFARKARCAGGSPRSSVYR
jgi:hypothetical protein